MSYPTLSIEEIRGLAKLERDMESGEQAYVINDGHRWAFAQEVLDKCGVISGQEVSNLLLIAIMRETVAHMDDLIKTQEPDVEVEPVEITG